MVVTLQNRRATIALSILVTLLVFNELHKSSKLPTQEQVRSSLVSNLIPNRKKYFIDKDGNHIPIFDEHTLYPKPGGGYCNMTPIKDKEEYFWYMEHATVECKNLSHFAEYYVCFDGFTKKDNCVIMSFGSSYNFDYEDYIIDRFGCKAHTFDPTTDQENFERKNGLNKFYKLGVSSYTGVKTIDYLDRKNRKCKIDRYVNIINMLGLAKTEIDFFKMDIEGSELDFFLDTAANNPELLTNIKQIQIEFHNIEECCFWHSGNSPNTTQFDMWKIVQIMKCHGFACVHTFMTRVQSLHFTYHGKKRATNYITAWIKV